MPHETEQSQTVQNRAEPIGTVWDGAGRRVRWQRCPCPKCGHPLTKVEVTNTMENGVIVRKRRCKSCDRFFFTAQEPEYLLPRSAVAFRDKPFLRDG